MFRGFRSCALVHGYHFFSGAYVHFFLRCRLQEVQACKLTKGRQYSAFFTKIKTGQPQLLPPLTVQFYSRMQVPAYVVGGGILGMVGKGKSVFQAPFLAHFQGFIMLRVEHIVISFYQYKLCGRVALQQMQKLGPLGIVVRVK